jgi:ribonuclease R
VVGRRKKKIYTLGDKVKIRVKKTDIDKRLIDLVFADQKTEKGRRSESGRGKWVEEEEWGD